MNLRDADPAALRSWAAKLLSPVAAAVVAIACYLPSLPNQFTYDDAFIIAGNSAVQDVLDWRAIWLSDWWHLPIEDAIDHRRDRLYRPLTLFSFAVNYAFSELNPFSYHLVNVALHGWVTWLVWILTYRLFADRTAAGVAALLFAVHPVHAEAVANVVGRAEVLSTLFILLGLLALLPRARAGGPAPLRCLAAGGWFLAALLAKETAICYPLVVALLVAHAARLTWIRAATAAALASWPLLIYFPLRIAALEGHLIRTDPPSLIHNPLVNAGGLEHVIGVFTVFGHYVRLLLAPADLSSSYGYATIDPAEGVGMFTLGGILGAAGLAVLLIRRPRDDSDTALRMLAAMFLVSYILISNAFLIIGVAVAERLMYWPSVAFAMGVGITAIRVDRVLRKPELMRALRLCGVALLVALGLRSAARSLDWYDNFTLFDRDLAAHPEGVHLIANYAELWLPELARGEGAPDSATHLAMIAARLDQALARVPRFPLAVRLRGQAYLLAGDRTSAEQFFERTLVLNPADGAAARLLRTLRGQDIDSIAAELSAQAEQHPDDPAALVALGRHWLESGYSVRAAEVFEQAQRRFPGDVESIRGLAESYARLLREPEARALFEKLIIASPDDWQAHANLAMLLGASDPRASLRHARRAFAINPNDIRVRNNLAEALVLNDRKSEAIEVLLGIRDQLAVDDPLRIAIDHRIGELRRD